MANPSAPTTLFLPNSSAPRRPSDLWFESLADIDGASAPPIMFFGLEDKIVALRYYRPQDPRIPFLEDSVRGRTPLSHPTSDPRNNAPAAPLRQARVDSPPPPPSNAGSAVEADDSYHITVTMRWSGIEQVQPTGRSSNKAPVAKKLSENKSVTLSLKHISRTDFITACIRAHDQHEKYRIGTNGPTFKLWWSGCGAKGNAVSIDTDTEFQESLDAILAKKKTASFQVVVDFDVDQWTPFRIRIQTHDDEDTNTEEDELIHGTKVLRLGDFTNDEILNGKFVRILEKRWVCNAHPGENNGPGYCYVDAAGTHFGLNFRKMKNWAACMSAGIASALEPPNNIEFDGMCDGQSATKPRGRNGPYRQDNNSLNASESPAAVLMTVLAARLMGDLAPLASLPPIPSTPKKAQPIPATFSPIPPSSSELHACLVDFREKQGVDLTGCESELVQLCYRPSIISLVSLEHLMEVTGAPEGDALLFKVFCADWCTRLDEKKRSVAAAL
ncbi:hypothetical protein DFP72DRAFT_1079271 [Ephemerocybe angulata]|uniref:Uncharacterized protein n=1 Tax=Ephemerocybe angulata TaxID=980116 RepID=A0A8H6LU62_9AGAR|nr:hypothetical protein DFP72DRAFT_1079271 [Tulosesus angulatus]